MDSWEWEIISWIAVILLASSYWFQIYKIYKIKHVEDLSIIFYLFLTIGFSILTVTAYHEDSFIFMVKNIITAIPAGLTLLQIFYYKD